MMKYKKYIGSTEISMEDNILHGKLLYIKDLVTYEADSPQSLEEAFKEAVDYYIDDCKSDGVEPDVPFKGSFNVRIAPETHRALAISAHSKGCALNEYVRIVLEGHEENKNSPSASTHYHFNIEGRPKGIVTQTASYGSERSSGKSVMYMAKYIDQTNPNKAAKCH
mgnify:CR=1 FL=1